MITSNRRIFLAIFLSLVIFFGIKYIYSNPLVFRPDNIYASITQKTAELKIKISSIKLPNLKKLFTLNFDYQTNSDTDKSIHQNQTSFSLPTVSQPSPTDFNQLYPIPSDSIQLYPSPTNKPSPTSRPTAVPRPPTAVPRPPTAVPRPTATPRPQPTVTPRPTATPAPSPITSDTRPGISLTEIFKEVNKRECIPVPLLMAFQTQESGSFFNKDNPPSIIKIYNTYGWWQTGAGDPCFGLGYHSQTGIVPQDSVKAGVRCRNAVGNLADQRIMGILQIGQWEQEVSRKNTISTLPKNIDRRVLFDNAIIFASITKNRVGNLAPDSCDDWPDDVIKIAAEKHHGSCEYNYGNGKSGNYCTEVLQLYKQYK